MLPTNPLPARDQADLDGQLAAVVGFLEDGELDEVLTLAVERFVDPPAAFAAAGAGVAFSQVDAGSSPATAGPSVSSAATRAGAPRPRARPVRPDRGSVQLPEEAGESNPDDGTCSEPRTEKTRTSHLQLSREHPPSPSI